MPIADLTGTKWVINDNPIITSGYGAFYLDFDGEYSDLSGIAIGYKASSYHSGGDLVPGNSIFFLGDAGGKYTVEGSLISITGGADATNSTLISWLEANATQVPVVDLTDTTWVIDSLICNAGYGQFDVQGTVLDEYGEAPADRLLNFMWIGYSRVNFDTGQPVPYQNTVCYSNLPAVLEVGWTITIDSGTDIANPDLIAWLSQNATYQEPAPTLDSIAIEDYEVAHFNTGDMFIFQGKVIAIYTDSSRVDVTNEATFSGYDMSIAGTYAVTASYGGKTTSFNIIVDGLAGWFVKGSLNDWQAMPKYNFKLHDVDKPEGAIHQYLLTVEFEVNDEFKFNLLNPEVWLGLASIEEGGAKSNFETYNDNIRCKVAGKYRFYLKEFSNYYTVYAMYVPVIVNQNGSFATVTLKDNILTVGGVSYKLVGTTTGSEESTLAFKEIEAFVDNEGLINIRVGNATFKGEDYQQASNFVLANLDYLETKDGLLFCVQEDEIYDITNSITNGYATGDSTIATGATVEITLHANTGYVIPETVTVTGASYTYSNGVVSLSNPTDDITITATCLEQLQAPYIELVEVE